MYAAIDIESKLIFAVVLFGRHGTDPAAAFLQKFREKHDLSDAEFLIDQVGYLTALFQLGLSGQVTCIDRNQIERWFHTLKMRCDRFYSFWRGSQARLAVGYDGSNTTTTMTDRIRRSTGELLLRRPRTRQCPVALDLLSEMSDILGEIAPCRHMQPERL